MRYAVDKKRNVQRYAEPRIEVYPERIPQRFIPKVRRYSHRKGDYEDEEQDWVKPRTRSSNECH